MATVRRTHAGVEIASEHYRIVLLPIAYAWCAGDPDAEAQTEIAVSVSATAALIGGDRGVRLQPVEVAPNYPVDGITVKPDRLLCARQSVPEAPAFREGFALELEAGMADLLSTWLPRIDRTAKLAQRLYGVAQTQLGRQPLPHECNAIDDVAADNVLDGDAAAGAIEGALNGYTGARWFDPESVEANGLTELLAALWKAAKQGHFYPAATEDHE
jgi:hypothetical protein